MKTLKKVIALLTPKEHKQGAMVLFMVMFMALLETMSVASVMPFLAVLGNPNMLETNPILEAFYSQSQSFGVESADEFLIVLGIGAFVLIIVSAVYRTMTHYAMNRFIEMRRHSISLRLLETYLRQPYAFFLDRHSSDISKSILSEVDQLIHEILYPTYNMFAYSLVVITITLLLFMAHPWLAVFAIGLLGGLYAVLFIGIRAKLSQLGSTLVMANKERFMTASEAFGGIKAIKLLGNERNYLNQFDHHSRKFSETAATNKTMTQVPKFVIEALAFGGIIVIVLVLMIGAGGLSNESLGKILPLVGLYTFSAYRLQPALQNVFQGVASLRYGQTLVANISTGLHADNGVAQLSEVIPGSLEAQHFITLDAVSYNYPKTVKQSLSNLNLQISVGSSVGIVGSTGAGKTTLVDLILGLLRPTQGIISIDGDPITDTQIRSWQKSLGYVPQEIFLTDTSIYENIAFGIPKENIDKDRVKHCSLIAQLHDFIVEDLPAQYETIVGERGVRFSGGQRQRIGIARALYNDPKVLLFDEATSALDTVTEKAVMTAIEALSSNQKTVIIIAHRLSTVKNCDLIVLLEQGEIQTVGTYSQLVNESEQFNKLSDQDMVIEKIQN